MRKTAPLILAVSMLCAAAARANPMLDLCLPVAPKSCALTDQSPREDILKCFENVTLDLKKPAERRCAEELLHAKVHAACDDADIPKLCGKIKPGGNRTMDCLNNNHAKLTKACSGALDRYNLLDASSRKKGRKGGGISAVRC